MFVVNRTWDEKFIKFKADVMNQLSQAPNDVMSSLNEIPTWLICVLAFLALTMVIMISMKVFGYLRSLFPSIGVSKFDSKVVECLLF